MPKVRLGVAKDFAVLRQLDAVSAVADAKDGQQFHVLQDDDVLDFFLDCEGLIVAEEDGQVVGYMLTHLVDRMHGGKRLAWIEHIGVHPDHRGKGVGTEMLRFASDYYKGRAGCLHASIHPLNKASLRLFESFGAECVERALVFIDL